MFDPDGHEWMLFYVEKNELDPPESTAPAETGIGVSAPANADPRLLGYAIPGAVDSRANGYGCWVEPPRTTRTPSSGNVTHRRAKG